MNTELYIKRDPILVLFYVVCVIAATFLLYRGTVRWDQMQYAVVGLLLPSVIGRKDKKRKDESRSAGQQVSPSEQEKSLQPQAASPDEKREEVPVTTDEK